jgi:spermidine/putrescine transport system substrate-binding protein
MSNEKHITALVPEALAARLGRRAFLGGLAVAGLSPLLASCATGSGSTSGSGSGTGTLNIYTWGEYDDPAVISGYADVEGGATISLDSYSSNPELISKLSTARGTSGYDICVPTHSSIQQMVAGDLLEELDHSLLPNMKNLNKGVLDTEFDPGNVYSVCKDWGSTGYVYDTTAIQRELRSWKDFWDAAFNEASGSFSLLEDQGEVAYAYYLANGISMLTTDDADIQAYRDFIVNQAAQHVQAFESYPSGTVAQNGRILAHCWNGDARQGILNNEDPERYRFVWPEEGANLWQDNWCIVKGSPNVEGAHAFIDYILQPDVSLQELTYIGYNTGVDGIEEAAEEAGVERTDLIFVDDAIMSKLQYSQESSATEKHIEIYNELTAAAG